MNSDCLKLTTYFGERERVEGGFLADRFAETFARHDLQTSLLLRGAAGFGAKQHLRSDRQLTLSEDLPLTAIAVDASARIEAVAAELERFPFDGLLTLERARMLTDASDVAALPEELGDEVKLTIYLGRQQRLGGRPAYQAVVDRLHEAGIAGATVLLGVDGTAHGTRERARFFARNAEVPLMVISVGSAELIAAVADDLAQSVARPLMTLERIRVCKRDGVRIREPGSSGGLAWQKLMVYASEQARHDGRPLYLELLRRLRAAGAAGATSLRGIWGYHGDHQPHGDTFWQLRRRVPVLTVIVDTPDRIARWFEIADELTDHTGLVTCENVPFFSPRSAP